MLFEQRTVLAVASEGLPVHIVHHEIGRAVLLEYIAHADDALVVQNAECLGLADEFPLVFVHHFQHALCAHGDPVGICVAVAVVLHEELLDGYALFEQDMLGLVGAAEAAGGDEAHDAIHTGMEQSAGRQVVGRIGHDLHLFLNTEFSEIIFG